MENENALATSPTESHLENSVAASSTKRKKHQRKKVTKLGATLPAQLEKTGSSDAIGESSSILEKRIKTLWDDVGRSMAEMESKKQELLDLEKKLQLEKKFVAELTDKQSKRVHLNVGGRKFESTITTLTSQPGSMLAAMFSGNYDMDTDDEGCYFIDRDGSVFHHILSFLRDPNIPPLVSSVQERLILLREAKFYQLQNLVKFLLRPRIPTVSDILDEGDLASIGLLPRNQHHSNSYGIQLSYTHSDKERDKMQDRIHRYNSPSHSISSTATLPGAEQAAPTSPTSPHRQHHAQPAEIEEQRHHHHHQEAQDSEEVSINNLNLNLSNLNLGLNMDPIDEIPACCECPDCGNINYHAFNYNRMRGVSGGPSTSSSGNSCRQFMLCGVTFSTDVRGGEPYYYLVKEQKRILNHYLQDGFSVDQVASTGDIRSGAFLLLSRPSHRNEIL